MALSHPSGRGTGSQGAALEAAAQLFALIGKNVILEI